MVEGKDRVGLAEVVVIREATGPAMFHTEVEVIGVDHNVVGEELMVGGVIRLRKLEPRTMVVDRQVQMNATIVVKWDTSGQIVQSGWRHRSVLIAMNSDIEDMHAQKVRYSHKPSRKARG